MFTLGLKFVSLNYIFSFCQYPACSRHTFLELSGHTDYVREEIAGREIQFTGHQAIAVLKPVEGGCTAKDVCREAAIFEASYYPWKPKYGGMEAADIKKIQAPETSSVV